MCLASDLKGLCEKGVARRTRAENDRFTTEKRMSEAGGVPEAGANVGIVLPAHNEAAFLPAVLRGIPSWVTAVVVVDDCSTDGTGEAALQVNDPRVEVVRTPSNLGVGGATLVGLRRLLERGVDVMVKMDADGQMPVSCLGLLVDAIGKDGYDYAKGNRFLAGESLSQMPRHRLLGNIFLTFFTKLASGYWHVFDPQNGFVAIRADVLRAMDLDRIHPGFFFENDMLIHLNILGRRVKDVAIPTIYGEEESDISLVKVAMTFPPLLLRGFLRRVYQRYVLRDFSPIALFLAVGVALFSWGCAFGAYHWAQSAISGRPTLTGTIMLAVIPLILGFQLVLQAIVLDIQETPR